MRQSIDELKNGVVFNGYDYELQVWVEGGRVRDCSHPEHMKSAGCCNGHKYAGWKVNELFGHEKRTEAII